jgi:peptidase M28-like protein/PA domain-containing protein
MVTIKTNAMLKNLGFSLAFAVILCLLQPQLAAQPDNGLVTGTAQGAVQQVPSAQICQTRANDTTDKLLECVQQSELWQILSHFQQISDENPGSDGHGNRDTGTSGYKASVSFVAGLMKQAGYNVTVQTYQFNATKVVGVPRFSTSDENYVLQRDFSVARLSGGGTVNAVVQPPAGSGDGCLANDFAEFKPGNIALLERGTCAFDVQVANSQSAGASAVVIYNTPEAGQQQLGQFAGSAEKPPVFPARLIHQAKIPVIGVASYSVGAGLLEQYRAGNVPQVHIDIRTQALSGPDYNLIAESPYGDPNHTVVIEGHLDSIFGAGMLDNASGSTTILEIALKMAKTPTRNRLRYIWFGGEELGLLGSGYYTSHLSSNERKIIAFDLDADVTATPNFDYYVADPATACNSWEFPSNVIPQSKPATQLWIDYFNSIGLVAQSGPFGNCGTDSNNFALIGIPDTGVLTMQDCCKSQSEVNIWGGYQGNYEGNIPGFDGGCCDQPGRWCDNLSNNDPTVLTIVSKATAYVTFKLANYPFQ